MKSSMVVLAALLACGGCKKKIDAMKQTAAMRDEHRASLKQRCLPAYESARAAQQPLAEDKVVDVPALHGGANANAATLTEAWAASTEFRASKNGKQRDVPGEFVFDRMTGADQPELADLCAWLIEEGSPSESPSPHNDQMGKISDEQVVDLVAKALARFEAVHYIVVLRVVHYDEPVAKEGQLQPGRVQAEARIFDDKGAPHGGFRFEATSSAKVGYVNQVDKSGEVVHDDQYNAIHEDVENNARAAFTKALAAAVPGSDLALP